MKPLPPSLGRAASAALALSVTFAPGPAAAGTARIAVTDSARELLAGEAKGAAVSSEPEKKEFSRPS